MKLEELERRWYSEPDQEDVLRQLLHSYKRFNLEAPFTHLLSLPHWKSLTQLVHHFYRKPLTEEDGESSDAIRKKEAELGVLLPETLKEWYRLVGRRFESCHDTFPRLKDLQIETPPFCDEDRRQLNYSKNFRVIKLSKATTKRKSVWLTSDDFSAANPPLKVIQPASLTGPRDFTTISSLPEYLIGHCYKETFESWEFRNGPLGRMREIMFSGEQRAQSQSYLSHYQPCFNDKTNETLGGPRYYSDSDTIFSVSDGSINGIYMNKDSYHRMRERLAFDDFQEYSLQFQWRDPLTLRPFFWLGDGCRSWFWSRLNKHSHLSSSLNLRFSDDSEAGCFQRIETTDPIDDYEQVKVALLLHFPKLLDGFQVGYRPYVSDRWIPLWPRDLTEFTPMELSSDLNPQSAED